MIYLTFLVINLSHDSFMNETVVDCNTDERINNLLPICQVKFISIALIIFMLQSILQKCSQAQW